jgi:murein DD-endopeptidase MepM/ murein hydrolase activator NlpD
MNRRAVTIVVHTDGDLRTRQVRLPLWVFRAGQGLAAAIVVLILLFFAFAAPLTRNAARVPRLEAEVSRLRAESARVGELAEALNRAEASYQSVRDILGRRRTGTGRNPEVEPVQTRRAAPISAVAPSAPRRYETGPSVPSHWPLDVRGFVTRGQVVAGSTVEEHGGIDIAVPPGSPVRAAGGGAVALTGVDPDYGLFVLLRHPDGYETMYGHTSRLLVRDGDDIGAGQVIALSGNTGRSTAPHLHFEIRRGGRSLDPLTFVKEGS